MAEVGAEPLHRAHSSPPALRRVGVTAEQSRATDRKRTRLVPGPRDRSGHTADAAGHCQPCPAANLLPETNLWGRYQTQRTLRTLSRHLSLSQLTEEEMGADGDPGGKHRWSGAGSMSGAGEASGPERLLTAKEVAAIVGVSPKRLYELGIPAVRISDRALRWRPSTVAAWIASRENAA